MRTVDLWNHIKSTSLMSSQQVKSGRFSCWLIATACENVDDWTQSSSNVESKSWVFFLNCFKHLPILPLICCRSWWQQPQWLTQAQLAAGTWESQIDQLIINSCLNLRHEVGAILRQFQCHTMVNSIQTPFNCRRRSNLSGAYCTKKIWIIQKNYTTAEISWRDRVFNYLSWAVGV